MRPKIVKCRPGFWLVLLFALAPAPASAMGFNFEMRQLLPGINPIARDVYACETCTLEQFEAIPVPAGWEKAPARTQLFSSAINLGSPDNGVPTSIDFVPDVPGNEFEYVARVLSGTVVGFDLGLGPLAIAQVQRDVEFTYDAGSVIHEVIDPTGERYILFTFDFALSESTYDLMAEDSLAALALPAGWTYESSTLSEALVFDSDGLATVFSQGGIASWQRYAGVPEPSAAALALAAAIGFATLTRRGTRA